MSETNISGTGNIGQLYSTASNMANMYDAMAQNSQRYGAPGGSTTPSGISDEAWQSLLAKYPNTNQPIPTPTAKVAAPGQSMGPDEFMSKITGYVNASRPANIFSDDQWSSLSQQYIQNMTSGNWKTPVVQGQSAPGVTASTYNPNSTTNVASQVAAAVLPPSGNSQSVNPVSTSITKPTSSSTASNPWQEMLSKYKAF